MITTHTGIGLGTSRTGYGLSSRLTLDSITGYAVTLDLALYGEAHTSADRLIPIDSDLQGLELGFWTDHAWAQSVGFTHGEDVAINTTQRSVDTLTALNSKYTPLGGSLRNAGLTPAPERGTRTMGAIHLLAYLCRKHSIS